ncbi:MAG: DUF3822 family protein [Bacteroides sp.]|nr:DUF3822 family protein [Bacteroides sp.]MCM1389333.1 DUF3822 family protein [Bacteroides sp.]
MTQQPLDSSLIANPRLYNLILRVEPARLDVMIYNGDEEDSIIYRSIRLDTALSQIAALEETVYDNPVLLGDFNKITVIIATTEYAITPEWASTDEILAGMVADKLLVNDDNETELLNIPMHDTGISVMLKPETRLTAFLRRTFNNPEILHHIVPLIRYFSKSDRLGTAGKIFVNLRNDSLDIISFSNNSPHLINTFRFRDKMDAVYYILACREQLKENGSDHEILISGNSDIREEITPILRRYVGYVMPVIFPSTIFKAAKDTMKAPFDLIVLPLCE